MIYQKKLRLNLFYQENIVDSFGNFFITCKSWLLMYLGFMPQGFTHFGLGPRVCLLKVENVTYISKQNIIKNVVKRLDFKLNMSFLENQFRP